MRQKKYRRDPWVERLWLDAERAARGRSGPAIVRALAEASDRVWSAGLDHAFAELKKGPLEKRALDFDASWLTVFVLELRSIKKR